MVSVIIPAYNASLCLSKAIQSALDQQREPLEVIIVDDGSTDETAAVVNTFGNRVRYFFQNNQGQAAARNAGLGHAQGEFVAFLDADDFWLSRFIETCVAFLQANPDAIAVSTGMSIQSAGGKTQTFPSVLRYPFKTGNRPFIIEDFFDFWATHNHVRSGTVMIRRNILEKAGPMMADLNFHEDLEYWGYLATFGPWGLIPEVLWVCDSERQGIRSGWYQKYRRRRLKLHTIERWEERIRPRLQFADWNGYKKVRGRVALDLARAHILSGQYDQALSLIQKYGDDFQPSPTTTLLRRCAKSSNLSWQVGCTLIQLRDFQSFLTKWVTYQWLSLARHVIAKSHSGPIEHKDIKC